VNIASRLAISDATGATCDISGGPSRLGGE